MKGLKTVINNITAKKNRKKALLLSLVALIEILAIMVVSTSGWIESISSIKIYTQGDAKGVVENALNQRVSLSTSGNDIDLTKYFRPSGGYHLAPASSADGNTMYFKGGTSGTKTNYRLGSVSDKNVNYVSFTIKTTTKVNLAFAQVPTIKFGGTALSNANKGLVRFSVGDNSGNFKIYSLADETTEDVVNAEDGGTSTITVHSFSDFVTGKDRVVETTANGYLSFNMWIQDPTGAKSSVYQNKALSVENFKLVVVTPLTVKAVSNNVVGNEGGNVAIENSAYGASATCYVSVGQKVNLHAAPSTTNGYQFIGWFNNSTDTTALSNSSVDPYEYTVPSANKTLYAKFSNQHELYMKPDYTHDGNVRYAAYVFGGNTHTWYSMTKVTSGTWNGYYKCSYTGSAQSVIFCYMNPSNTTNSFTNCWLQTFDLKVPYANGEYGFIVTSRSVYKSSGNFNEGDSISDFGTNKLLGYWKHNYAQVKVDYKSDSDSGTKGTITAKLYDSTTNYSTVTRYTSSDGKSVDLDGEAYKDVDSNGNYIANQFYDKKVVLTAADSSTMNFEGWYNSSGTSVSTDKTCIVTAPDNKTTGSGVNSVTYYAKYTKKPETYYVTASFNSWSTSSNALTGTGNELTNVQTLNAGTYEFKIYEATNAVHYTNGYDYHDSYLGASGGDTLTTSGNNMKLTVTTTSDYTFHFNKSTKKFWLTKVTKETWHVLGGFNNWNTSSGQMSVSGNEATLTLTLNGSYEFKIYSSTGSYYANGYGYHDSYKGASGGDTLTTSGNNMTLNATNKSYTFHFNTSTHKFWIT